MYPKAYDILRDKENKIKMLFNEFETLKKKIFICYQERREEPSHTNSVRPNKTYQSRRQIYKSPRKEQESDLMKLKVEKYEQLLRYRTEIFYDKERYLQKALKQEKINLYILRYTYEKKLRRANKITIPWTVEYLVEKIKIPYGIYEKISTYDKRMRLLSYMLVELRKAIDLKILKSSEDLEDVITEKVKIYLELAEKEEIIKELKYQIEYNNNSYRQNEIISKLQKIYYYRREYSKLFELRLRELEEQLENYALYKYKLMLKQMQLQKEVEKPNKEEKLQKYLKEIQNQLVYLKNYHDSTIKYLLTADEQNNELKLELDTLSRQNKLSISNYESQLFTLKYYYSSAEETKRKLYAQAAKLYYDNKRWKIQYENKITLLNQDKSTLYEQLSRMRKYSATKDEYLNRFRQDKNKGPSMQTRREIYGYQRYIEYLKIMLSALQDQIDKNNYYENKKLKYSLCIRETEVNKLTDKCYQLNKYIEELKSIKPSFEQAMIEVNQNSSELKKKMMKPKRDNIIPKTISEMIVREIRSEDDKELLDERLKEFNEEPDPVVPAGNDSPMHKNHRSMLYSVNMTNQKHLLDRINSLEKYLELTIVEKEFQKSKREKLEEELKSMEVDQQRFQNQKDLLKQELNLVNQEAKTLKDHSKKLIYLILVENRKAFKANIYVLRTTINEILSLVGSDRYQGALKHQLKTQIEDKKGIFYG